MLALNKLRMKQFFITFLLGFFILYPSIAQQETDLREVFLTAEMYYSYEEFNEALPLYLRLHRNFPDNDNYNFKIGVCFLNNPYEKNKSINYLELAAKNINIKYKENNFKETGAPLEALFYLGTAYRINNNLEKAQEYYNRFLNQLDPEVYDNQLVLEQLEACKTAEKLMKKPIDFDAENVGEPLNTRFADKSPVLSGDETKIVYISELQFYDAIFYSEKVNGKWQPPRNIVPELGVDGDVYPTCLSYNGTELYIYRNDDFIGNLYISRLMNGKWTPLKKLNENINTKYWESHASVSKDGKSLYFSSNRKGGYGGLDIYKSTRQADGEWGPATNLGPVVNSRYNDDTPFITENENKIFFSSYGHYSMGGYDIFMSVKKDDGTWASPVNIGYPINSTDDDQFLVPLHDGQIAYFSKFAEDGSGRHDIYRYKVYTPDHPRLFNVSGLLDYMGEDADAQKVLISVIDKETGDTIQQVHPKGDGNFTVQVPAGDYKMLFESERFKQRIADLQVAQNTPHEGFSIPGAFSLEPLPVILSQEELDKLLELKDTLIVVDEGKPVKIRFNAEKGSNAVIHVLNDSVQIAADTLSVDRRRMTYEFEPEPGVNDVIITLTDPEGNVVTKKVQVIYPLEEATIEDENSSTVLSEEKNTREIIKQDEEDARIQNSKFKDFIISNSDGELKAFLEQTDLKALGIENEKDLIDYLYKNADKEAYSTEDVDKLMKKLIAQKSIYQFMAELEDAAEGNLKATISKIDPVEEGITEAINLVQHLIDISAANKYEDTDVVKALSIVAAGSIDDPDKFLEILKSESEGDLKEFLDNYSMPEKLSSIESLGLDIYNVAKSKNQDTDEYLNLLTDLAVSKDAELLRQRLYSLAEGDLKALLDTLNLEANSIYTAGDLIDYLMKNEAELNYSKEDLTDLLTKSIVEENNAAETLRKQMETIATGKLKEVLADLDLQSAHINSPEDLLNYLKKTAEENAYSEADINEVLLKLAYKGDLDDVIKRMSEFADGNLKSSLLSLDPRNENIEDLGQLIEYLFSNTEKYGYSEEDVIKMLSEYSKYGEMEGFLKNLIKLSQGKTRDFLISIDVEDLGIKNKQQLINYLLSEADNGVIDKEEIISLILRADNVSAEKLIPALLNLSDESMTSFISELPENLITADQVFKYMLERSADHGLKRKDVVELFSNYLDNYALNVFLKKLKENSSDSLLETLNKLNLKDEGITNVSDLIKYLLNNADQFGYTAQDVYRAIAASMNQDNIQDFISNLSKYAKGNLKKALDDIHDNQMIFNNADELIRYLLDNAEKYGYSESDIWNLLLKVIMSDNIDDSEALSQNVDLNMKAKFNRALIWSFGVLAFLGLIIFIFILLERRKKKEESE